MKPTVASLATGIGGIDLGLEWAGFEIRWQCEIDPYCRRVLAKHWPDIPCYEDVRKLPDDIEPVDLVCGGYPCQPFSLAGARRGANDPRNLWPAFVSTLRLLRPRHALLENVPGHLSLGFGTVLADLAEIGYDAEWTCIPAAAVGAPHLRWRLFVVAHANGQRGRLQPVCESWCSGASVALDDGSSLDVAHAVGHPLSPSTDPLTQAGGSRCPTGQPGWWTAEPEVGRVADGVPSRVDRLRAVGNAVVPQVAHFIGTQLLQHLEAAA